MTSVASETTATAAVSVPDPESPTKPTRNVLAALEPFSPAGAVNKVEIVLAFGDTPETGIVGDGNDSAKLTLVQQRVTATAELSAFNEIVILAVQLSRTAEKKGGGKPVKGPTSGYYSITMSMPARVGRETAMMLVNRTAGINFVHTFDQRNMSVWQSVVVVPSHVRVHSILNTLAGLNKLTIGDTEELVLKDGFAMAICAPSTNGIHGNDRIAIYMSCKTRIFAEELFKPKIVMAEDGSGPTITDSSGKARVIETVLPPFNTRELWVAGVPHSDDLETDGPLFLILQHLGIPNGLTGGFD